VMFSIDTPTLVALVVSIYGALLSTILAINEIRKGKRQVRVTIGVNRTYELREDDRSWIVVLHVANIGYRPVVIVDAGLTIKKNTLNIITPHILNRDAPLPVKLEDGERIELQFNFNVIQSIIDDYRGKSVRGCLRIVAR
jgi:hypothetical protein